MGDYDPGRRHASGQLTPCHPQLDAPVKKRQIGRYGDLENLTFTPSPYRPFAASKISFCLTRETPSRKMVQVSKTERELWEGKPK